MIAATDCHYRRNEAMCGAILFSNWATAVPDLELRELFPDPAPYRPGSFYLRELPCVLKLLQAVQGRFDTVIVDGYVWLGPDGRPGLGAHLFQALRRTIPVVGIAKSPFQGSPHAERVYRGNSRRPLFVTAAGMDGHEAAEHVKRMHGPHRIPTLLKRVDQLCRAQQ